MEHTIQDIANELSYFSLFDVAEKARWKVSDIPWDQIDHSSVDDNLIGLVKSIAFNEFTTFTATQSFMDLFADDIDFTQWMAVWLYEETKHPHVLVKWLSLVGESVSGQFLLDGREITPMNQSKVEMLTFNIISEIVAGSTYLHGKNLVPEPVLQTILGNLGADEMRHSVGFEHYCRKLIDEAENPDEQRMLCLRAGWVFLGTESSISHPVFRATEGIEAHFGRDVVEKIRTRIARRIAKVAGVDIPEPDDIYDVYRSFKARIRNTKARQSNANGAATELDGTAVERPSRP